VYSKAVLSVEEKTANQLYFFGDRSLAFGPRLSTISHKNYNEAQLFILSVARINSVVLIGLREWPMYLDYVVTRAGAPYLFSQHITNHGVFGQSAGTERRSYLSFYTLYLQTQSEYLNKISYCAYTLKFLFL